MGGPIQGQMLRRTARREVAIYLRSGTVWVADFIDGDGHIVDAATWIRFNCASASTYHARRRMVRESAVPVSRELSMRIERLHEASVVRFRRTDPFYRVFARAVRRMFRRQRSAAVTKVVP